MTIMIEDFGFANILLDEKSDENNLIYDISYKNLDKLLFLSSSPSLTLKVLTFSLMLVNVKSNGNITSSKYPIK